MAQKQILSMAEYDRIDRINAEFAEHVMGWLAVGQRSVYQSSTNQEKKTWQGAPTRSSKLEDVPRYWQSLEEAWKGLSILPVDSTIEIHSDPIHWLCLVRINSVYNFANLEAHAVGETPSQAIVRCLLKLAGHPLPEPE